MNHRREKKSKMLKSLTSHWWQRLCALSGVPQGGRPGPSWIDCRTGLFAALASSQIPLTFCGSLSLSLAPSRDVSFDICLVSSLSFVFDLAPCLCVWLPLYLCMSLCVYVCLRARAFVYFLPFFNRRVFILFPQNLWL